MTIVSLPLSSIINFTRSSSAWYTNTSGTYVESPINTPRINYDVEKETRYLLIEPASENLIRDSKFTTSVLAGVLSDYATIDSGSIASEVIAINTLNGVTSVTVNFDGVADQDVIKVHLDSISAIDNTDYSFILTKEINDSGIDSSISVETDIRTVYQNKSDGSVYLLANTSDISLVPTVNIPVTIGETYNFNLTLSKPQLEPLPFVTSFIPTELTTVQRDEEIATINTLGDWYSSTEGTLVVKYSSVGSTNSRRFKVGFTDTLSQRDLGFRSAENISARIESGSGDIEFKHLNGIVIDDKKYLLAISYKQNDSFSMIDNTFSTVDTNCVIDTFDKLLIGTDGASGQLCSGKIDFIKFFPKKLSKEEVSNLFGTESEIIVITEF